MSTGERIMNLRQKAGMSQEAFGEKLGVSRQAVSKWETGQTVPDIEKVILISELCGVSTDYILKGEESVKSDGNDNFAPSDNTGNSLNRGFGGIRQSLHYEHKSKRKLFGLPLVHINIGLGAYRAKGIISIGMISTGLLSVGLLSIGLLSLGMLSLGLIALGSFAFGGISLGAISVGLMALGGVAVGIISMGGLSIGMYSWGGCAIGSKIAFGGYAQGYIALGDSAVGEYTWDIGDGYTQTIKDEVMAVINSKLQDTPEFILNFLR